MALSDKRLLSELGKLRAGIRRIIQQEEEERKRQELLAIPFVIPRKNGKSNGKQIKQSSKPTVQKGFTFTEVPFKNISGSYTEVTKNAFDEEKHPRDEKGEFIESGRKLDSGAIKEVMDEIEKRWRSRTPAKNVGDLDPGSRVNRSEVVMIFKQKGLGTPPIQHDEYDRALFQLYDRLKKEFPNEQWQSATSRTQDRRKELGLKRDTKPKRTENAFCPTGPGGGIVCQWASTSMSARIRSRNGSEHSARMWKSQPSPSPSSTTSRSSAVR
jgi:hypothetical protein